jgi:hypothetical protein
MQWRRQRGIARRATVLARERTRLEPRKTEDANVPDAPTWKEKAVTLRHSATQQRNPLERQTLLTLAEDCEAIAAELESQAQQPGKPKPPGNPPRPPAREAPQPIREPPRPIPPPPVEPPPPPMTAQKLQRQR